MERPFYLRADKHRYPVSNASLVLPNSIGHNDLKYVMTLSTKLSHVSHTAIEGPFDFNKIPLVPHGIKLSVHKKPQQLKTWQSMEYWDDTSAQQFINTVDTLDIHQTQEGR